MSINPDDLIGLRASFDGKDGKRLVGVVTAATDNGFAEPGHIPDFLISVRGSSGHVMSGISLVESHMNFPE